jgi:hypothetical protein
MTAVLRCHRAQGGESAVSRRTSRWRRLTPGLWRRPTSRAGSQRISPSAREASPLTALARGSPEPTVLLRPQGGGEPSQSSAPSSAAQSAFPRWVAQTTSAAAKRTAATIKKGPAVIAKDTK